MNELASCVFDLVVCLLCFAATLVRLSQVRNRVWLTMVFAVGCSMIAEAYWTVYLVVFGETPAYFYVSEICWAATYVFFIMLLVECDASRDSHASVPAAWIPVAVSAVLLVLFVYLKGNPLFNFLDNGLMALIGYFAVRGMVAPPAPGLAGNRAFATSLLIYVIVELAVWTASCLIGAGGFMFYVVLSYAIALALMLIVACAWKSEHI